MKSDPTKFLIAGCLALVGVAALLLWLKTGRSTLYSDPAAVRVSPIYDAVMSPAKAPPDIPPFDTNSVAVTTNVGSVEIQMAVAETAAGEDRIYNYTVHRAGPDQVVSLPEGKVRLDYIGVGYGPFVLEKENEYSARLPGRFFHSNLQPFTDEEVQARIGRSWDRSLDFRGDFPQVRFSFATEDFPEFKLLGVQLFDARTHRRLTSGYSWSDGQPNQFWFETGVRLWHAAPVLLVVSLAHGPVETIEVAPTQGAVIRYATGELHLVSVLEGNEAGWGSSSDGRTNRITVHLRPTETEKQPEATFIWLGLPQANPIPLSFEYLDGEGKVLPGAGGGSSGEVVIGSTRARRTEVATVRAKHYPQVKRLIFRLPEIPGLPEENRDLENLFAMKIPYLRLKEEYRLREALESLVQMDLTPYRSVQFPPGSFPLVLTNATPLDLVAEYERFLGKEYRLRADHEKQQLIIAPPFYQQIAERVAKFFRDRF